MTRWLRPGRARLFLSQIVLLLGVALTLPRVNVCTLDLQQRPGRGPGRELLARFRVRLGAGGTRSVPAVGAGGGGADACCMLCLLLLNADVAVTFAFLFWFGLARVGVLVHVAPDL